MHPKQNNEDPDDTMTDNVYLRSNLPLPKNEVMIAPVPFLEQLRNANIARQDEWEVGGKNSLSYRGNELAGEVGEACNVIKKIEREALGNVGSRATKQDLADELADVIICVDLIAAEFGIDLEEATKAKFNKTSNKYNLNTVME